MKENELTPKESLAIIQGVLDQTKQKYEENGLTTLVWGILVFCAGVTQYAMASTGNYEKSYLPWVFTMIPGFIITFVAKAIENAKRKKRNRANDQMGFVWLMAGTMAMVTGFIVAPKHNTPMLTTLIWAPFCVAAFATALYLKESLLIAMSILAAILTFTALYLPGIYHPILTALIALVLMVIPGIKLYKDHKFRNRV